MTPLISLWLVAWGRSEVMPIDLSKTGSFTVWEGGVSM